VSDHARQNLFESIPVEPRIYDRLIRPQHPFKPIQLSIFGAPDALPLTAAIHVEIGLALKN
jgi:hypothetical protein